MPWARILATASAILAVACLVVAGAGFRSGTSATEATWFLVTLVVGLPSLLLGTVLGWQQPRNAVGPLLSSVGLALLAVGATDVYADAARRRPDGLPVSDVVVSLSEGAWVWMFVPVALLVLCFPDGRPPSRRWWWVGAVLVAVALVDNLLTAMVPTPYQPPYQDAPHALGTLPEWTTWLWVVLAPGFLGLLIACALSARVRLRRGGPVERAQVLWLAVAGTGVPVTLLLCWASYLVLGGPDLVVVGLVVTALAVPAAVAVAVLRHDLYDATRAAVLAITGTLMTTAGLLVFTVVAVATGVAAGRGGTLGTALATVAAVLVLQPVRRRVRGRVARWVDPDRADILAAVADLRNRAHAGEASPEDLQRVLRAASGDPGLRVGYRQPGTEELLDADGAPVVTTAASVTVRLGEMEVGALVPNLPQPRGLLADVAAESALLVEVGRLRQEARSAQAEAESSRARLLHAGYAERRRLERDLHDGAQQRLVSLGMSLRVAQRKLARGRPGELGVAMDGLLDAAVAELATAVAELRQLAHGLRPSSLDDGLGPALLNLTRGLREGAPSIVVDVEVAAGGAIGDLPDDISTTAYFVASEAVANAVKHARPARIALTVDRSAERLLVRIDDDGRGGATVRPGSGLAGLGDRVAAVGGSLRVRSPDRGGTTVEAVLPCAS